MPEADVTGFGDDEAGRLSSVQILDVVFGTDDDVELVPAIERQEDAQAGLGVGPMGIGG